MKKSEPHKTEELAGEFEAPLRLTPDQLEGVAAGFAARLIRGGGTTASTGGGATQGYAPAEPPIRMF